MWRRIGLDSSNLDGDNIEPIEIVGDDGKGSSSSETIFSYVVPLFYSFDRDVFVPMAEAGGAWYLSGDAVPE